MRTPVVQSTYRTSVCCRRRGRRLRNAIPYPITRNQSRTRTAANSRNVPKSLCRGANSQTQSHATRLTSTLLRRRIPRYTTVLVQSVSPATCKVLHATYAPGQFPIYADGVDNAVDGLNRRSSCIAESNQLTRCLTDNCPAGSSPFDAWWVDNPGARPDA